MNTEALPSFPQRNRLPLIFFETHSSRSSPFVSLLLIKTRTVQYSIMESYHKAVVMTGPSLTVWEATGSDGD